MELIASFPDDIEVSLGQLKRFNKSVIDPKCLLKAEATSFCFDNNLSFSSNIFSCILLFQFQKYGLHAFENGLEITINTKFLKILQFDLFIQISHEVSLSLKLNNVTQILIYLPCF